MPGIPCPEARDSEKGAKKHQKRGQSHIKEQLCFATLIVAPIKQEKQVSLGMVRNYYRNKKIVH